MGIENFEVEEARERGWLQFKIKWAGNENQIVFSKDGYHNISRLTCFPCNVTSILFPSEGRESMFHPLNLGGFVTMMKRILC